MKRTYLPSLAPGLVGFGLGVLITWIWEDSSGYRGESWFHIEITPDITLNVRGDYSRDELALFEQIADHVRQILLEDS